MSIHHGIRGSDRTEIVGQTADPFMDHGSETSSLPIGDYALLSDCHSAGLVSTGGSVDWLCFPRFDSPSIFGRLLDAEAGHWSIRPAAKFRVRRRYLDDSLVLETTFMTAQGVATLTDGLIFDRHERGHDIGREAPHVVARLVEVSEGVVDMVAEFRPRPEYGIVRPRLERSDGVLVSSGGAETLWLDGPGPDDLRDGTAHWVRTSTAVTRSASRCITADEGLLCPSAGPSAKPVIA